MKLIDAEVVLNYIDATREEVAEDSSPSSDAYIRGWDAGYTDGFSAVRDFVKDIIIEDEIPLATPSDMIPKSEFIRLLEAIQERSEDWDECNFIDGIMEAYK